MKKDHLRTVKFHNGHTLTTWDVHETDRYGKSVLGYELSTPDGTVVFAGEDFYCSPCYAIDSDDCLRSILGFLTLRPGDTDDEYFEKYTPEQLAWAIENGEYAGLWAQDDEPEPWEQTDQPEVEE